MCSAFHAEPKYSIVNPRRSRIRIFWDEWNDLWVPLLAGEYTEAECLGRTVVKIKGKEYGECSFCRSSCPSRELFKEPDAPDIPLKCDMCEEEPPLPEPLCVKWCKSDALTYEEREEEEEEEERVEQKQLQVEILVKKYGLEEIRNILTRISKG
jgi:benzoyl-CoA reductase subunit BamC